MSWRVSDYAWMRASEPYLAGTGLRRLGADDGGQTVVIVALLFTVLLGFAGLAIDGGRFYAERRFLQNAADAAALGCVQKLVVGGTTTDAESAAKTILRTYDLPGDPTGSGVVVSDTPQYNDWFNGDIADKRNLYDGAVASNTDCRVALQVEFQTFFLRLLGMGTISLPVNAHAVAKGGMLPVVVNRYLDPPGPSVSFIDYTKQETYQLAHPNTCSENDGGGCTDAAYSPLTCTSGCLFGPETVIAGGGYSSSDSDFRGFIALDIRDFSSSSHLYYNGVSATTNTNQLKGVEAGYVVDGYPGPDLETYVPGSDPVQAGLQIATMSGNSSGAIVDEFAKTYAPGDRVLVQLFDGQVREIPDFTINAPSTIDAASPSGPATGPTFRVGANQRFRATTCSGGYSCYVHLDMVRDAFDVSGNDTPTALHDFTFDVNDFTPAGGSGTQVTIQGLQVDSGLASGIYSVIVKGTGHLHDGTTSSTHESWIPLNVGGATRDFTMDFSATESEVATLGATATYSFDLSTGSSAHAWGCGGCPETPVSFAFDKGSCVTGNVALFLVSGTTAVCATATFSPSASATPDKNAPPTVTISIPTTGAAQGTYQLVLRARGTNGAGQPVVHVQPLDLYIVSIPGTSTKYVNVQGYVLFMITSIDANTVKGRAISGDYANPNDAALATAHKSGLVPWEVAPY